MASWAKRDAATALECAPHTRQGAVCAYGKQSRSSSKLIKHHGQALLRSRTTHEAVISHVQQRVVGAAHVGHVHVVRGGGQVLHLLA